MPQLQVFGGFGESTENNTFGIVPKQGQYRPKSDFRLRLVMELHAPKSELTGYIAEVTREHSGTKG